MSSIPLHRFVLLVATVALGAVACSNSEDASLFEGRNDGTSGGTNPTGPEEPPPPTPITSDGGPPKSQYKWNPLCHLEQNPVCVPDDDGRSTALGPKCTTGDDHGCRLARNMTALGPACGPTTEKGLDGVACQTGADCARGFDCVEGTKGNVCRRYCCAGSCGTNTSQNGGDTFCDVQKLVDPMAKGPVCMPLKRCTLLKAGECADNETCATVGEGRTGCVAKGEAGIGKSCDEQHCAAELTCIGVPGSRKCYQLCKVSASGCPSNQMCKTSAAFSDSSFGVCTAP